MDPPWCQSVFLRALSLCDVLQWFSVVPTWLDEVVCKTEVTRWLLGRNHTVVMVTYYHMRTVSITGWLLSIIFMWFV